MKRVSVVLLLVISICFSQVYAFTSPSAAFTCTRLAQPRQSISSTKQPSSGLLGKSVISKQQQQTQQRSTGKSTTSALRMGWNNNDNEVFGSDRILSCLPYLLPLLDGDSFGRYIYMRLPPVYMLERVLLGPLLTIYQAVPFLGFGLFLLLAFGSRNASLSRAVRFNMQQAILLDIALIFPQILGSVTGGANLPRAIVEPSTNFVFYALVVCVTYAVVSNLTGKKPNGIPVISEAAEVSVGPF